MLFGCRKCSFTNTFSMKRLEEWKTVLHATSFHTLHTFVLCSPFEWTTMGKIITGQKKRVLQTIKLDKKFGRSEKCIWSFRLRTTKSHTNNKTINNRMCLCIRTTYLVTCDNKRFMTLLLNSNTHTHTHSRSIYNCIFCVRFFLPDPEGSSH